ncbi:MAG: undecaprenyl diphosphate synthase [Chloroflexota bacterium]|nr:undecaprenyl diphosphate synthase [Chloroflexota bacterium]
MSPESKQSAQTTVKHVGIIPDGNRRWARQNNIDLEEAYWLAMQKIADCAEALFKAGVHSLSVYLLSKDNILRARDDLEAVVIAETRMLRELIPALQRELGVRVYHAGNPASLDADFRAALEEVCEPGNGVGDPFPRLYLLAGYDAFEEVTDARAAIGPDPDKLLDSLSVPVPLDLVIRSGRDQRISGFLPLQCKYAEFFFEPYFFPDITPERALAVLDDFQNRSRRFGK